MNERPIDPSDPVASARQAGLSESADVTEPTSPTGPEGSNVAGAEHEIGSTNTTRSEGASLSAGSTRPVASPQDGGPAKSADLSTPAGQSGHGDWPRPRSGAGSAGPRLHQAVAELLGRARTLGADPRNTNYAGGNASAKAMETDPVTGRPVELIWVKGSGGDLGTLKESGLAVLRLDRVRALKTIYPGVDREDEMVETFEYCLHGKGGAAPSIDTAMHALVEAAHVDHLHPDAGIAIAAAADGPALTERIFGDRVLWVPWRRPGFQLGLDIAAIQQANPQAIGVILGGHGITAWGATSEECQANSLEIIRTAERYIAAHGRSDPFGPVVHESLSDDVRRAKAAALFPLLRGLASTDAPAVGHYTATPEVLDFLARAEHPRLAALGTSCPDHFLRTKVAPLVLPPDPTEEQVRAAHAAYRQEYAAYYARHATPSSPPMRGADPAIVLVPGVGMFSFGKDKQTARVAGEFYINAINVMRGAEALSTYAPIEESEKFRIEYWDLEEAKLRRLPPPRPLAARVALVTGGGSGIGAAVARRLAAEGACVVIADRDLAAARKVAAEIAPSAGPDGETAIPGGVVLGVRADAGEDGGAAVPDVALGVRTDVADDKGSARGHAALAACAGAAEGEGSVRGDVVLAVRADVTDEAQVQEVVRRAVLAFGGLDLVVNNAGLSLSRPLLETTLDDWDLQHDVMARGSFLVSREAARILICQGMGGDIVYISSKNAVFAGPNNVAYGAAKADQAHQVRLLAAELGEHGVRVNGVNPDGVVRGSGIFASGWGANRAAVYGVPEERLGEFYAQRTLLKREVLPEHVAAAVFALTGGDLSLTTGLHVPVDAGVAAAFLR
ncbi:bifunctional rhamnulose-1-phosphate aldolase/short-chain dehydrogenase [Nonomuraea typhae]|uniref:Bifunctional rhamnulose-1-phosphate aldolase/short-chain dehydrogenase n=1 Tax=Nonomuraea typhae TaxID=2603600 RepID=A0ABW7YQF3_9ACTN